MAGIRRNTTEERVFRTVSAAAAVFGVGVGLTACASYSAPGGDQSFAYLQRAQAAAEAHDAAAALAALNGAESAWLLIDTPRSNPCMYNAAPELRAIGNARASVQQAQWRDAEHYIGTALASVGLPG